MVILYSLPVRPALVRVGCYSILKKGIATNDSFGEQLLLTFYRDASSRTSTSIRAAKAIFTVQRIL
jgi:hypothetical protein